MIARTTIGQHPWQLMLLLSLPFAVTQGGAAQEAIAADSAVSANVAAARVAVLLLRAEAGVRRSDSLPSYFLGMLDEPLSAEMTATALAQLPKPVRCEANAVNGRVMISCEHAPNVGTGRGEDASQTETLWRRAIDQVWGRRVQEPILLMKYGPDSIAVPLRALSQFQRDYDIPHLLGGETRTTTELPNGVHFVIDVRPAPPAAVEIH